MPTPTTGSSFLYSTLTGNDTIDALLSGVQWESPTLTYSFPTLASYWSTSPDDGYGNDGEPWTGGYGALFNTDKSAIQKALTSWANVANLHFTQVLDNASVVGDLRFAYATLSQDAQGWAYYPSGGPASGDVWFNADGSSYDNQWIAGSYEYATAVHEIGHALGLKHPFDDSWLTTAVLPVELDTMSHTIMSYSAYAGDTQSYFTYEPTTPMVLDIAAIQALYGANTAFNAGNTIYNFTEGGSYHMTIWDGGGTDTIAYASSTGGLIDLRSGIESGSNLGTQVYAVDVSNQYHAVSDIWIAYGATIENATGGSGNDTLIGNAADNILDGGLGADTLTGGLGNDTYVVDNAGDSVTENLGEGTDLVKVTIATTNGTYTLEDNVENGSLTNTVAFNLTGNALANVLTGNAANNTLDGGAGADAMNGGGGNDTYVVDDAGDTIIDSAGIDTVQAGVSYTLASPLENLTLAGADPINGTGTALANVLTGNGGTNVLTGLAGNDTYIIGAGDLIVELASGGTDLVQSSATHTLEANVENLTLTGSDDIDGTGNVLANVLTGNSGDNVLDGGLGKDTLKGGLGDDTYIVDLTSAIRLQDKITENMNEGSDTIVLRGGNTTLTKVSALTLGANLENLDASGTTTTKLNLTGNALVNTLVGNEANNTLDGGLGADNLAGGLGNDTYVVDNTGDSITEAYGAGTDLVKVAVSAANGTYILSDNVENVTLTNKVAFNLTGNDLYNTLTGNAANNVLDGGEGADTMNGGGGNDTYVVDDAGDTIIDSAGIDTVRASVSYTLASTLENLTLTGSNNIGGAGNALANILTGNDGANILSGGAGNDTYYVGAGDSIVELFGGGTDLVNAAVSYILDDNVENLTLTGSDDIDGIGNALANVLTGNDGNNALFGQNGDDRLIGGLGNDYLDGGLGHDTMIGGLGDDTYLIDSTRDVITEGANAGNDAIVEEINSYTLATANIETLILGGTSDLIAFGSARNDTLIGNSGNNQLYGGDGSDVLIGGAGNDQLYGGGLTGFSGSDTLIGGNGNDTYWYVTAATQAVETPGEGDDTVALAYSNTGAAPMIIDKGSLFANIEVLTLYYSTGKFDVVGTSSADVISGNSYASILEGRGGDDYLIGGGNGDTLMGGTDNDYYSISNASESIVEQADEGHDQVSFSGNNNSATAITLSYANVETISVSGSGLFNLTANNLGNTLIGNDSENVITSGSASDVLQGKGGNDSFVFASSLDGVTNVDTILDFTSGDRIVLDQTIFGALGGAIQDGNILAAAGAESATNSDQHVIYNTTTGALYYDSDGSGGIAATQFAILDLSEWSPWSHPSTLAASDFTVI